MSLKKIILIGIFMSAAFFGGMYSNGIFRLMEYRQAQYVKKMKQEEFPIVKVISKVSTKKFSVLEEFKIDGKQGAILAAPSGARIVALVLDGYLVFGNAFDKDGADLTEVAARRKNGDNIITLLAKQCQANAPFQKISVRHPSSHTASIAPMQPEPPAARGEITINKELFDYLVQLPGTKLRPESSGSVRLVLFSWRSCPTCVNLKQYFARQEVSFQVLEVPVGGNPHEEARLRDALGEKLQTADGKAAIKGMQEAAEIIKTLTGKLAVPQYAWLMPDGSARFGFLSGRDLMDRVELLNSLSKG